MVSPAANAGLQANAAGALAYLAGIITGILFLVIDPYKSDRFVRFHAFQSIFFNVAWIALWMAWMIDSAQSWPGVTSRGAIQQRMPSRSSTAQMASAVVLSLDE